MAKYCWNPLSHSGAFNLKKIIVIITIYTTFNIKMEWFSRANLMENWNELYIYLLKYFIAITKSISRAFHLPEHIQINNLRVL